MSGDETTWRDVTIAWARVSQPRDFTEADLAAMGSAQLARFGRLTGREAAGFLAGRKLIRDVVRRLRAGDEVRIDSRCVRCGEHHGAPRTPGVALSVSHAGDLVVVAASRHAQTLGVDIEAVVAESRMTQLAPMFAAASVPDLAGWTRIEAAVKADGRGFEIEPSAVRLHPLPLDRGEWSAALPGRATRLRVATIEGPDGYVLSIARD